MIPPPDPAVAAVLERLGVVAREAGRRATEIEAGRALPRDVVEALVASGVFLLSRPGSLGGFDADLGTLLQAVEQVAFHDGSTGWCVLAGLASGLDASALARHHAETVFGDPQTLVVGSRHLGGQGRLLDDGGLQVNGRWSWGTASAHAQWIGAGVRVLGDPEDAPPAEVQVYLRRDQVVVLDTWYPVGLQGSGSTDFLATEAIVPEGRWVPGGGVQPTATGVDADGLLTIGAAAVALGLATRAVEELVALGDAPVDAAGCRLADWAPARLELARAAAEVRAVRADLSTMARLVDASGAPGPDDGATGRDLASVACHGVERSVSVVERCFRAAGPQAIEYASPLQRLLRDIEVVAQHPAVSSPILDGVGRELFAARSTATPR